MNKNQTTGKWKQFKGYLKKVYGAVTNDGFQKAEGSFDRLSGVVQEKVGDVEEGMRRSGFEMSSMVTSTFG